MKQLAIVLLIAAAACNSQKREGVELRSAQGDRPDGCADLIGESDLKTLLMKAPEEGEAGGLFHGRQEWVAVVNRAGEVCAEVVETADPAASWPGAIAIAKAKAYTANGFSSDTLAMSTARLYTMSLPGHSLWSAANGNPFNPACLTSAANPKSSTATCGGTIAFGGGVALYKKGKVVGGLGASGDTPCADHEIAKRIRHAANMDPAKGPYVDDITYSKADGASLYTHPLCPNTWRNGTRIGDEPIASGY